MSDDRRNDKLEIKVFSLDHMVVYRTLAFLSFVTYASHVSIEQIKEEIASLSFEAQTEVVSFVLQRRYARDKEYLREVRERLDDTDKTHWITPEEFERALDLP